MPDGSFRYASWDRDASVLSAPEFVAGDGELRYEGSGGNHYFEFKKGSYTYVVDVSVLGKYDNIGTLEVRKAGEALLELDADQAFD